jgi:hypothetical protein
MRIVANFILFIDAFIHLTIKLIDFKNIYREMLAQYII